MKGGQGRSREMFEEWGVVSLDLRGDRGGSYSGTLSTAEHRWGGPSFRSCGASRDDHLAPPALYTDQLTLFFHLAPPAPSILHLALLSSTACASFFSPHRRIVRRVPALSSVTPWRTPGHPLAGRHISIAVSYLQASHTFHPSHSISSFVRFRPAVEMGPRQTSCWCLIYARGIILVITPAYIRPVCRTYFLAPP